MIDTIYSDPNFLQHYGVKGMKWGVRKQQVSDGKRRVKRRQLTDKQKTVIKTAAIIGGSVVATGLAVYGAKTVSQLDKDLISKYRNTIWYQAERYRKLASDYRQTADDTRTYADILKKQGRKEQMARNIEMAKRQYSTADRLDNTANQLVSKAKNTTNTSLKNKISYYERGDVSKAAKTVVNNTKTKAEHMKEVNDSVKRANGIKKKLRSTNNSNK